MYCNDSNCNFNVKGNCMKLGTCLKNIDHSGKIKNQINQYWGNMRNKYKNKVKR